MGWLFRLQFCFDDWLFLLDSCSFALFLLDDCGFALFCFVFVFFFPSCSGLDQPPVSDWLRFCFCSGWLFLWWLGGGWVVVGCNFGGWLWLYFGFFLFSILPASGCGCHGSAMTCGGSGYGGLWLL